MRQTLMVRGVVLTGLLLALGCSPRTGPGVRVRGTVQFQDRPVPAGRIYFSPDVNRGGSGPQGFANIHNGTFDTAQQGRSAPLGPVVLRISGGDGTRALFMPYDEPAELLTADATLDVTVPATRAIGATEMMVP